MEGAGTRLNTATVESPVGGSLSGTQFVSRARRQWLPRYVRHLGLGALGYY